MVPLASRADDPDPAVEQVAQAERFSEEAFMAYEARQYAQALMLYRKAYDAAPAAVILYNIARIYDVGLQDRPLAINFYRRYVSDPSAEAELTKTANERLISLRAAEQLAAQEAASSPRPLPASASPIEAAPPAPPPSAASAQSTTVAPPFEARAETAAAQSRDDRGSITLAGPLILGAAGIIGIGVGTGFGIAAIHDAKTVDRYCDGNNCASKVGVDAVQSGTDKALVSTLCLAIGGAAVAGAIVWLLLRPNETDVATRRVAWAPSLGKDTLGATLRARF